MSEQIVIPTRFRGPSASGNGGYSCGVLARRIGAAAEVNLRLPPPLEQSLTLETDGSALELKDGDAVVADGGPAVVEISAPEPPSMSQARHAVDRYVGFRSHPFPECFVCGPHRDHHDGLHIFPGRVQGSDMVATPWIPDPSLPADDGQVASEVVGAALDCPTGFGCAFREGRPAVLARLRGELACPVEIGRPHIVIGWPIGRDGRKLGRRLGPLHIGRRAGRLRRRPVDGATPAELRNDYVKGDLVGGKPGGVIGVDGDLTFGA